jgi:hypothetical protein
MTALSCLVGGDTEGELAADAFRHARVQRDEEGTALAVLWRGTGDSRTRRHGRGVKEAEEALRTSRCSGATARCGHTAGGREDLVGDLGDTAGEPVRGIAHRRIPAGRR